MDILPNLEPEDQPLQTAHPPQAAFKSVKNPPLDKDKEGKRPGKPVFFCLESEIAPLIGVK